MASINNPSTLKMLALIKTAKLSNVLKYEHILPVSIYTLLERLNKIEKIMCNQCFKFICCNHFSHNWVEFDKNLIDVYDDYIDFCKNCAEKIKLLPIEKYIDRLSYLFSNSEYWEMFFHTYYGEFDDVKNWNFEELTLEQSLLLKMHPEMSLEFCDEYIWVAKKTTYKNCIKCLEKKINKNVFKPTQIDVMHISSDEFLYEYLLNDDAWCQNCIYVPLFSLYNIDN